MIVYDKISSEIIKYLSESFSGCDRLGIVPFESIALIIVRNKNIALPVEVVFDGIVHAFGEKDSDELTRLSIVLNDLIFLYYSNEVHFDSVSKSEIIELRNQVDFYRSKYEDLYVQISDLKKELTIKNYEITKKNDELSKMKIYK